MLLVINELKCSNAQWIDLFESFSCGKLSVRVTTEELSSMILKRKIDNIKLYARSVPVCPLLCHLFESRRDCLGSRSKSFIIVLYILVSKSFVYSLHHEAVLQLLHIYSMSRK